MQETGIISGAVSQDSASIDEVNAAAEEQENEAAASLATVRLYLAESRRLSDDMARDDEEIARSREATRQNLREIHRAIARLQAA